jgi:cell division ATPase FtsA
VIKGGAVTNIETTVRSIREAIDKAELMAGLEIREVVVNLSARRSAGVSVPNGT